MKEARPLEPSSAMQEAKTVTAGGATFQTTTIAGEAHAYTGKKISLNLVDADGDGAVDDTLVIIDAANTVALLNVLPSQLNASNFTFA